MNKKWSIIITVGVMVVVYLFLLVAIPALASMVPPCGSCNQTANNSAISDNTVNWTAIGPALRDKDKPLREIYKAPLIVYLIPGLVGIAAIGVILSQKKEAGENE